MILEIYLFVDPFDNDSFKAEKIVTQVSKNLNTKFSIHFVPMLTLKTINNNSSQQLANAAYNLILDFKAASFQGKRCGRQFLMASQTALIEKQLPYSDQLIKQIAEQIGLDLEMFVEDRRSDLAHKCFKNDQHIVNEMQVNQPASAVIFNSTVDNNGILINNLDYHSLFNFCVSNIESSAHFEELAQGKSGPFETIILKNHN